MARKRYSSPKAIWKSPLYLTKKEKAIILFAMIAYTAVLGIISSIYFIYYLYILHSPTILLALILLFAPEVESS